MQPPRPTGLHYSYLSIFFARLRPDSIFLPLRLEIDILRAVSKGSSTKMYGTLIRGSPRVLKDPIRPSLRITSSSLGPAARIFRFRAEIGLKSRYFGVKIDISIEQLDIFSLENRHSGSIFCGQNSRYDSASLTEQLRFSEPVRHAS